MKKGSKHSDIAREKMRISHEGVKHSQEHIQSLILARTGKQNKRGWKMPEGFGENISERMKREGNPRWIADRTQLAKYKNGNEYRNSPAHREWSKQVKNRDGWRCRIANGDCSGPVVAHHILGWRDHPEVRYQTNNGITLCHFHHPRKRDEEERLSPYFQKMVAVEMN